eukprot:609977-Prymnesium_polylepis.2
MVGVGRCAQAWFQQRPNDLGELAPLSTPREPHSSLGLGSNIGTKVSLDSRAHRGLGANRKQ